MLHPPEKASNEVLAYQGLRSTSRVLKNLDEHGSAFFLTDSLVRLGWYLF